jgi:two-component system, NtrC family, response regulator HydG
MATPSRAAEQTAVPPSRTVVLHDRDATRRRHLAGDGAARGVRIVEADSTVEPLTCVRVGATPVGVVHLGDGGPDEPALAVIRDLTARGLPIIAYGGGLPHWPLGQRCQALLAGAVTLVDSAVDGFAPALWHQVTACFNLDAHAARTRAEAQALFGQLGIVGESGTMHRLYGWTSRVAPLSDLHVLVTGETGTGKQLFAQALHRLDPKRRHGPFVVVNCSAISAGLAESELFGHRRGAFTGAERDRPGLIRAAHGGVLLLDEIGDMETGLQAKLLRVLQEGRVLGVGDDREVAVDVRVVASTHRDLAAMVERGAFRADLFHRLNGLALHVPALRDRRGDIPALVAHVVARLARAGGPDVRASDEFLDAIARVPLSGNVRELQHIVRHALAVAAGAPVLGLTHLPAAIWSDVVAQGVTDAATPAAAPSTGHGSGGWPVHVPDAWTLARSLAWCERAIVARALEAVDGNQARAARLLGVTPRSVYNKLRKHQLVKKRA